jgi:hypothetical protein
MSMPPIIAIEEFEGLQISMPPIIVIEEFGL